MPTSLERISLPRGPGSLSQLTQSATHVLRVDRSGPALLIDVSAKKAVAHELRPEHQDTEVITGGGFSPDGTQLVLLCADMNERGARLETIDVLTRERLSAFALPKELAKPYGVTVHPDGQQLFLWAKPQTFVLSLKGKNLNSIATPNGFGLSPSAKFVSIEEEHGVFVVRPLAGKKGVTIEASDVAWLDDETLIAVTWEKTEKSGIHRVSAKTGKMKKLALIPQVSAFDVHGNWGLATNVKGKKVLVTSIDLTSGKTQPFELVGSPSGTAVSIGPAGGFVAVNWQKVLHVFSQGAAVKKAAPPPEKKPLPSGNAALIATIEANAAKARTKLNTGASEKTIAATEKALGVKFPEEVKAFYRVHDGSEGPGAVEDRELLSLSRIVQEWKIWKELLGKGTFGDNDHGEPDAGVQEKWWIPEWIPLTHDGSGNHHLLDLAPAKGGKAGQILSFWHDDAPRTVEGKNFLSWLAAADWGDPDHVDEAEAAAQDGDFTRYEMAQKFWAVRLDGSSFTVRFGKQGTEGQEQVKSFADDAAARKEFDKLVASKVKKGYSLAP
jgi:cell wall assembly regulator SMI1/predicted DNA-binding WGR domain protein